ncbi:hypothetical protein C483_02491 [Natrialba hulunbeirensis JCM 10989]|uniref:DUF488 domain-containing protein n=1 Tax=Natrialba hulunbeirensis JCM 10989 TaxID=1227493 RepID=M0A9Y2_9EURY|nr:DUF488 domain-containing protein [Natrialba hulunbeirensis]ELY95196.1 hypothetical protein C483_02491 [Natrialba hulunbeirensis JCM 10989]
MARDRRDGRDSATEVNQREGTLTDTYVAALQHDLADVSPETTLVGVVRSPTSWFHAAVDENIPELAPPADLLDAVRTAEDDLKMRGICDEEAHNAAWEQVGFGDAYREHLQTADDAERALESLADRLASGESLALVCYENTEKKRCHRTILRDVLESRR